MENKRLCESDFRLMDIVWENEPVSSMRLVELCEEKLGWKKSTTFTMLKKLSQKGLLKNEKAVVTALVGRREIESSESDIFVSQTFGGSLPGFLAAFLGARAVSDEEAEELKALIDSCKASRRAADAANGSAASPERSGE